MRQNTSRRKFLIGTGATVATATGVLIATSQETSATVEVSELQIPDKERTLADQTIEDVQLSVDADYSWSGNAPIHKAEVILTVGSTTDTTETIATFTQDDLSKEALTGTETLQGSVLGTSTYSADNFEPRTGTKTIGLVVVLEFNLYRDGEIVESATATEPVDVIVTKEELNYTLSLSANGKVNITTA